jgi:hypothetical protein
VVDKEKAEIIQTTIKRKILTIHDSVPGILFTKKERIQNPTYVQLINTMQHNHDRKKGEITAKKKKQDSLVRKRRIRRKIMIKKIMIRRAITNLICGNRHVQNFPKMVFDGSC